LPGSLAQGPAVDNDHGMLGLMQDTALTTNWIFDRGTQYYGTKTVTTKTATGLERKTFTEVAAETRRPCITSSTRREMAAGLGPLGNASPLDVLETRIALCTALRAVLFPPNVDRGGLCVIVAFEPLEHPARANDPSRMVSEAVAAPTRRVE